MQPLIFLQQGDKAWIKRVGGAAELRKQNAFLRDSDLLKTRKSV